MIRTSSVVLALVLALCLLLPACDSSGGDHPPIFDQRPYAEAKAAAEADGKLLIVKGTATWCGPCQQMDKTTWRDEQVVAWLKEHAIVVAVDVDAEQATAQELAIQAMPTMIAFKDGKEIGRIVGMLGPTQFLPWLDSLLRRG